MIRYIREQHVMIENSHFIVIQTIFSDTRFRFFEIELKIDEIECNRVDRDENFFFFIFFHFFFNEKRMKKTFILILAFKKKKQI